MEQEFRNRRKNYFIDRKFQSIFILKFCALVVTGAIISGVIIYALSSSTVTTTFENSRLAIKSTADYILPAVLLSGAIAIILIGLATITVTLFASHRIAGPLYRVEKDLEEIAAGNLRKTFNLRETDELKKLAEDLNNTVESLRTEIERLKRAANEAKLADIKRILDKFKT